MRMEFRFAPAAFAILLSACSNEQVYNSLQGARENECMKIVDTTQRNQCLSEAHKSYQQYEQQRNESRAQ